MVGAVVEDQGTHAILVVEEDDSEKKVGAA